MTENYPSKADELPRSLILLLPSANDHIRLNTPVLVRSLKLSSVEPSQYLDGIKFGQFLYWIPNWRLQNTEMNEKYRCRKS